MFVDDSPLFAPILKGDSQLTINGLHTDLTKISNWAKQWLVSLNASKTVGVHFSRKTCPSRIPPIILNDEPIKLVKSHKHLGITLNSSLTWTDHINSIRSKCNRLLGLLKRFKYRWSRTALETSYKSFIRPIIEYGDIIYDSCTKAESKLIESLQLEAARTVTGAKRGTSHALLYSELGWQSLEKRRYVHKLCKMYQIVRDGKPPYLIEIIEPYKLTGNRLTRANTRGDFRVPKCKTSFYQTSFVINGISKWNELKNDLKLLLGLFKRKLSLEFKPEPTFFNHNTSRANQVALLQIRLNFSNLNNDLFNKGCIENKSCACGAAKEDAKHYFLQCTLYDTDRTILVRNLKQVAPVKNLSLALLLYGNKKFTEIENMSVLKCVYDFIQSTKRLL